VSSAPRCECSDRAVPSRLRRWARLPAVMRSLLLVSLATMVGCSAGPPAADRPAAGSGSALTVSSSAPLLVGEAPEDVDEDTSYRAPRAVLEQNRKHEAYGEPLPAGAVARLGTKKLFSGFTVVVAAADATFVSAASYYVGLQKWDPKTGALLATKPLKHESYFNVAATTADQKLGAFAEYKQIALVDLVTLETKRVIEVFEERSAARIHDVAFLDDGKLVVAACSKDASEALRIFDQQGSLVRSFSVPRPKESYEEACAGPIAIAKRRMIVGINRDAQLMSIDAGDVQGTFEAGVAVEAVAFSPDGSRFLVGGYGDAGNAFDTKTRKAVRSYGFFAQSDGEVRGVAFSPDGASVAVSASSGVRVYESATGLELARLGQVHGAVNAQHALATIGNILAFPMGGPDLIGRFDWTTGEQLTPHDLGRHDKELTEGVLTADGAAITASRDGTIRRWDAVTGAPVATLSHAFQQAPIALAKDGALLSLTASKRDETGYPRPRCAITVHDPATLAVREELVLREPKSREDCFPSRLLLSPDGTIAYARFRTRLIAAELATKKVLADVELPDYFGGAVAILSDGSVAARDEGRWSIRDARTLAKQRATDLIFESLVASPKGFVAASLARESESQLVLVSLESGKELARVEAPKGLRFTSAMTFSSDGGLLYVGVTSDGRSGVAAITVKGGKHLAVLDKLHEQAHPMSRFLSLSPDGKRLLEGNQDQTGLVLDTAKLQGGN
jgi:WD40 repeat protein